MPKYFSQLTRSLPQYGFDLRLSARLNIQNNTSYRAVLENKWLKVCCL